MLLPLLWKDIRLNRYVILLAIFLVDTPYLTTAFALSAFTGDSEVNTSLTERLSIAFPFSLLFLALASAFIGGTPIAAEKGRAGPIGSWLTCRRPALAVRSAAKY